MAKPLVEAREEFFKDCRFVAQAPGSYYWCGEHAAMCGQLAVAHAIPLYAFVGIEQIGCEQFEIELRGIRRESTIDLEKATIDAMEVVRQPYGRTRVIEYLDFWRRQHRQDYFRVKAWAEVPSRCGLNASAAGSAALAGLLQILETEESKQGALIQEVNSWGRRSVEELKGSPAFEAIFRKAWIMDDCAHNFSSAGTGAFCSLAGSPNGELLLHFSEKRGFDSLHPVERLSGDSAEVGHEALERAVQRISTIDWWGKRLPLKDDLREWLGIALVYSGVPKDTGDVLRKLEERYEIPIGEFKTIFSKFFPDGDAFVKAPRPVSDFVGEAGKPPRGGAFYTKSVFAESLGLLSWMLLRILDFDMRDKLFSHITAINRFLDFYSVFPKHLAKSYEAIKGDYDVGVKLVGPGAGGDFAVFGQAASMEGLEDRVGDPYPVHFSTNRMGWRAGGLTVTKAPDKKVAVVAPAGDTLEIGIAEDKPYLLVNREPPKRHLQERLFAPLLLIAVARREDVKVNKVKDLLLPDSPRKEQLLSEARQLLVTTAFKKEVNIGDILPSDGRGNVQLTVFERDCIFIDPSICKFESQHMARAERIADEIVQLRGKMEKDFDYRSGTEAGGGVSRQAQMEQAEMEASCMRLENEAKLTFRHTRMVIKAAEMMRWTFQDEGWWQRWQNFAAKCYGLFEYFGYDEAYIIEQIHLFWRGHQ